MSLEEFIVLYLLWVIGTVSGLVITGLLVDRLIVRKVMQNKEVQRFLQTIKKLTEYAEKIVENQEKSREGSSERKEHGPA